MNARVLLTKLLCCLLVGKTTSQNTPKKPLDTVIDELSSIARLTNGMAIQAEMMTDGSKMNEVVAELMGLRSESGIEKIKGLKVTEAAGQLAQLYPLVEQVPELKVNTSDLQKNFEALEIMKTHADVLEKKVNDPSVDLKKKIAAVIAISDTLGFYIVEEFKNVAENLTFIKKSPNPNTFPKIYEYFEVLKTSAIRVSEQLTNFEGFESDNRLKKVWNLQNMTDMLSDVSKYAVLSEQFATNYPTMSLMNTILGDLKNGISELKAVIDKQKSTPDLMTSLKDISDAAVELSNETPNDRLTVGLAGGVGDLKLMLEELKGDWMRKMIAGGKETTELAKQMDQLSVFREKMEGLDGNWKQMELEKYLDPLQKVSILVADASNKGQLAPDLGSIETTLTSLQKCFNDLTLSPDLPKYDQISSLLDDGRKVSEQITTYRKFLKSRIDTFKKTLEKVDTFVEDLKTLTKSTTTSNETRDGWKSIAEDAKTDEMINTLSTLHADFQQFATENPFETIKEIDQFVDWTAVPVLLQSLERSHLSATLKCMQTVSYQSKDIVSMLNIGNSVQAMKGQGKDFSLTKEFLSHMSNVQKGLVEVQSAVNPSRRRRRSRNKGSLSLDTLKNAGDMSTDLGRGVQVLRYFSRILDEEKSVMVAGDADDVLNTAIDAIPGSKSVWTQKNRESLKNMITDLKALNDDVAKMSRNDMSELWSPFDRARRVPGVDMDARVFADPIAIGLSSSSDPNVKAAANDFNVLATLHLDFAQHHTRLKAASLTLGALRQFFDDFFDINTSSDKPVQTSETVRGFNDPTPGSDVSYVVTIIVLIVIDVFCAVALAALCYERNEKSKNKTQPGEEEEKLLQDTQPAAPAKQEPKRKVKQDLDESDEIETDEKRAMMFEGLHWENVGGNALWNEAMHERGRWVRIYIDKHAYLNYNNEGRTPLHVAVEKRLTCSVEMLIYSGADRNRLNKFKQTPEQLAKSLLAQEKDEEKKKRFNEVLEVFKKCENQTFKATYRKLPIKFYIVYIVDDCDYSQTERFWEKFPELVYTEGVHKHLTHCVVKTDENGVLDVTDYSILRLVCGRTLFVDSSWLTACHNDKKNLRRDYEMRVTKFRFNEKVYKAMDQLKIWTCRGDIRCFEFVKIAYFEPNLRKDSEAFRATYAVGKYYGTFYTSLKDLLKGISAAKPTPEPYWFSNKKKHWIVYKDGAREELDLHLQELFLLYPEQKDAGFEIMSVIEFFEFFFKMASGKFPLGPDNKYIC